MPKVVAQQRRGRASNPQLLDCKSDTLPLSHCATPVVVVVVMVVVMMMVMMMRVVMIIQTWRQLTTTLTAS